VGDVDGDLTTEALFILVADSIASAPIHLTPHFKLFFSESFFFVFLNFPPTPETIPKRHSQLNRHSTELMEDGLHTTRSKKNGVNYRPRSKFKISSGRSRKKQTNSDGIFSPSRPQGRGVERKLMDVNNGGRGVAGWAGLIAHSHTHTHTQHTHMAVSSYTHTPPTRWFVIETVRDGRLICAAVQN